MAASAVTAARGRPLASNAASAARPSTSLQYRPTASSRSLARSVPLIILVFATVTSVADPASMPSGSTGTVHRAVTREQPDRIIVNAEIGIVNTGPDGSAG